MGQHLGRLFKKQPQPEPALAKNIVENRFNNREKSKQDTYLDGLQARAKINSLSNPFISEEEKEAGEINKAELIGEIIQASDAEYIPPAAPFTPKLK